MKNSGVKTKLIYALAIVFSCILHAQDSLRITHCGQSLKTVYLNMDVLHRWQSGEHIDWETGLPDNPDAITGIKTHCSAFVAAACENKNVYILRPPEHRQELLANAQYDWLNSSKSKNSGWHPIKENVLYKAQKKANDGYLVVVCAQNPDRHKPGHIALVMPSDLTLGQLHQLGPVLIQASTKNAVDARFRNAFRRHIRDWNSPQDDVIFFYNDKNVCR